MLPSGPNQRWSLDFVSDAFGDGWRSRILIVVGDFTRECLAPVGDISLSSLRVIRILDSLIFPRAKPSGHTRRLRRAWARNFKTTRKDKTENNGNPANAIPQIRWLIS